MEVAIIAVVVFCCLAGVAMTAVRMPGTWLILVSGAGYAWYGHWHHVSQRVIWVLVGIAVLAEAVEMVLSVVTARRAGASRKAAWGGLIGGFLGMFCLSPTVPIIPIGPVIGALLGCFAGATIGELIVRNKLADSTRVGLFSALGMALGTAVKLGLAFVMAAILLTSTILRN